MASPAVASTNDGRLVESTIECDVKPNATIGVTLSTDLPIKITKLLPSSTFLGKLFVGDHILNINGAVINNLGDFFKATKASNKLLIRIKRDEYCTCKVNVLPSPRAGIDSFEFEMNWRTGGMPIGILVYQDSEKRVIVSMIESGTLASQTLKPGDHLTKVNDVAITDKTMAKKLIVDSVNAVNKVKLTVERQTNGLSTPPIVPPTSPPAIKLPNYDLNLPNDVLTIMETNKNFYKIPSTNPSILKTSIPSTTSTPFVMPTGNHINMPEGLPMDEHQIEFDPSPKPLRTTPKRVGAA